MDWIGLDWIGLGQKSYISKFLQPFLFAQSFSGIPYCIGFLNMNIFIVPSLICGSTNVHLVLVFFVDN